ncbi:MAG: flagellar hook-length control protein FliK [candidate division Zixibacteria bacterium]|nr:flagellar hook-length control protein FliK [candidate division Zixibacteria bacterium]MDD5425275.1 flagellar hook-length control protein FliK [candidate division Zixibacteria bacterium]
MTSSGNNILALLPGNFSSGTNNSTSGFTGLQGISPAFFDIMNQLGIGPKVARQTLLNVPENYTAEPFDLLFDKSVEALFANEKLTNQSLKNLFYPDYCINDNNSEVTALKDGSLLTEGNLEPSINNARSDNVIVESPLRAVQTNKNLDDIINKMPLEIDTGKYRVLSSDITDGQLHLAVQPIDEPGQDIKISVPVQTLAGEFYQPATGSDFSNLLTMRPFNTVNVNSGWLNGTSSEWNKLFSRVNLKELEISNVSGEKDLQNRTGDSTGYKLVAELSGQEIILRGKLAKSDIKTRLENKSDNAGSRNINTVMTNKSLLPPAETILPEGKLNSSLRNMLIDNNFEKLNRYSETFTIDDFNTPDMGKVPINPVSNKLDMTASDTPRQTDMPSSIRFTLPDNLKQILKPNGRSVTIKMEPENLGPARLFLTVRDNTLSVRLMVENVQAKQLVESSLDQLTQQLSRYGIKVDYLEVGVNGGELQNNNFARQTVWGKPSRYNRYIFDDDLLTGIDEKPDVFVPAPDTYINVHGVNLLA